MVEWSKDLYVNPNLQANLGEQTSFVGYLRIFSYHIVSAWWMKSPSVLQMSALMDSAVFWCVYRSGASG